MEFVIRRANNDNLEKIQELMTELNEFQIKIFTLKNKPFHERIKEYSKLKISDIEKDIILVAEFNDKIVGYVWGSIHERKSHKLLKMGYIDEICVNHKFRLKGIASKLLKSLEEEFIKLNCDHIITHADADNETAQKSHSNFGMIPVTIEYWKKINK